MSERNTESPALSLEQRLELVERRLADITGNAVLDVVPVFQFDDGMIPTRQTEGAIGFDARARAIVDPISKPTQGNPLRRTMADFKRSNNWRDALDPSLLDRIVADTEGRDAYYGVVLPPGERLMVGLGFATAMAYPMYYWVAPRSGHASRGITIANSPGTVDPDYRGEAGALLENNSPIDFVISSGMRIAQVVFSLALIPDLSQVDSHDKLGTTGRASGGFGSTGTF